MAGRMIGSPLELASHHPGSTGHHKESVLACGCLFTVSEKNRPLSALISNLEAVPLIAQQTVLDDSLKQHVIQAWSVPCITCLANNRCQTASFLL